MYFTIAVMPTPRKYVPARQYTNLLQHLKLSYYGNYDDYRKSAAFSACLPLLIKMML